MSDNLSRYYFTEEHQLFRESLRKFLEKEVLPYIDEWEERQQVPKSLWRKFAEQGFLGFHYPPEYGGTGLDFFYTVVFTEEVSRVFSGGFGVIPLVTQYMSTPYIYKYGSETLRQKYLPPVIRGEKIAAIGISEPGAGSDVANIQTRAIRQGDSYIVTGQKTFISNGYYGDFVVLVVKTQPEAGINGISLLVVDLDSPGITRNKLRKLGWHASDTAELFFDQVRVPAENLIGEEGKGFFYLMDGLQLERLVGAIGAMAGIEHLMEYTLQYMAQRHTFGRPLNRYQVLRHRMAQLHAETQAIKSFVYHACRLFADGVYAVEECTIAKLLATELANKAAYECLQMFGGYGYIEDYRVARAYRDVRILTIGGGSSEIMREILSKILIDDRAYAAPTASARTSSNGEAISAVLDILRKRITAPPIGVRIGLDIGGHQLVIDGTGAENRLIEGSADAPCVLQVAPTDLQAMLTGQMNPMNAFLSGKIRIHGDMSQALQLQRLFQS